MNNKKLLRNPKCRKANNRVRKARWLLDRAVADYCDSMEVWSWQVGRYSALEDIYTYEKGAVDAAIAAKNVLNRAKGRYWNALRELRNCVISMGRH